MTPLRHIAFIVVLLALSGPSGARAGSIIPSPQEAKRSFASFAEAWMENARAGGAPVWRFGGGYRIEVERTGDPELPYLGVLRYERSMYECPKGRPVGCRLLHTRPMRHLFPFTNGRWQF
ncbi:MAG: hypothetical protein JRG95_01170 [Deltaproteobacteria bacterium]|nr:hypothetical protein [Deltaproteobacteria bacterium]